MVGRVSRKIILGRVSRKIMVGRVTGKNNGRPC